MKAVAQPCTIEIDATQSVSALLVAPPNALACYVLAHGAGAGMAHSFMEAVAAGLAERGIATFRYQFPYMESAAPGGRTRLRWPTRLFGRRWRKRRAGCRGLRWSPAASLSAGA